MSDENNKPRRIETLVEDTEGVMVSENESISETFA